MYGRYDTRKVCRILKVSRSGIYKNRKKKQSEEIALEKEIINCFENNKGRFGRKRIKKALERNGIKVSESKIARILRENELIALGGRQQKRKKQEKPTEEQYIEENLIRNKIEIIMANYLWCSDIKEFKIRGGKLYVCAIIDVGTRRIVGWAISKRQTQEIVQKAFLMAVGRNPDRPEGAVYHSDRGCQYTAKRTKELVEEYGFRKSMSRPGTPNDNQPIESFWHTVSVELPDVRKLNYEQAFKAIVEYIEMYYNSSRLHSGINYNIPNEFFTLQCVHFS